MHSYLHRREVRPFYPADWFPVLGILAAIALFPAVGFFLGAFCQYKSDRSENQRNRDAAEEMLTKAGEITAHNVQLFNGAALMLRRSVELRQEARDLLDAVKASGGSDELPEPTGEPQATPFPTPSANGLLL